MSASEWSHDETDESVSSSSPPIERFRPTGGRFTGLVLIVLGLGVAALSVVDHEGVVPWVGGAGLAFAVLGWVYLLRPRVWIESEHLVLRNPLSLVRVPLAAVEEVACRQVLVIGTAGHRYVAPGLGRSRGSLLKGARPDPKADPVARAQAASYGEYAEDRILHHMEDARARTGIALYSAEQAALAERVERRTAWPEVIALAGSVVLTLLLAVIG